MTSKTAILAAAVGSLFVLTTTAFAAESRLSEPCGVATLGQVITKMLERSQRGGGSAKSSTELARARMQRETDILSLS
jgi:hypothetical protein